jgi:hypothetical protein
MTASGHPSSYTRVRSTANVARSTSIPLQDEGTTPRARRWTKAETLEIVSRAPEFRFDSPSRVELDGLAEAYKEITGHQVRTWAQRNLLAAAYRVHGTDMIPFLADEFARQGSVTNLLGLVRSAPPRDGRDPGASTARDTGRRLEGSAPAPLAASPGDHFGPPCPVEQCVRAVIYCADHRPAFDSRSTRRWDRRDA